MYIHTPTLLEWDWGDGDLCAKGRSMEKRNHSSGTPNPLSQNDLDQLWEDFRTLHRSLDEKTERLRRSQDTELIRRAEEAGAAVQRLEWEMARYRAKQEKDFSR